jgi:hypothetical protein
MKDGKETPGPRAHGIISEVSIICIPFYYLTKSENLINDIKT